MVRSWRWRALGVLGILLVSLSSGGKLAQEATTPYAFKPAFTLRFFSLTGCVYCCKEKPLTLYYTQDFKEGVAEHFRAHRGEMLTQFKGGSLLLEGLGLAEIPHERPIEVAVPQGDFLDIVEVKGMIGINLFAVNGFGVKRGGTLQLERWLSAKIGGDDKSVRINFTVQGDATQIEMWNVPYSRPLIYRPPESLVGELKYEADSQGCPWIMVQDLDGDGNDEILIGQMSYRVQTIYAFSTAPEKFKGVRDLAETIWKFAGFPNKPGKDAEMFKKGSVKRIPLQ